MIRLDNAQRGELKAQILELGLDKRLNKQRRYIFEHSEELDPIECRRLLIEEYGETLYKLTLSVIRSRVWKTRKVKEKVNKQLLAGDVVFVTLTFTDDFLKRTNEKTRRAYVRRYLKSQSPCYVANIDFGRQNEREHYHALVQGPIDLAEWRKKKIGNIQVERIPPTSDDLTATAKYLAKLSNHALKASTRFIRLIYSRAPKKNARRKEVMIDD